MPIGGQVSFGAGLLVFTPAGANPTPVVFGALQDVSLKTSAALKELFGQNKYPISVAEGESKITGTAKFAQINGTLIKQALAGASLATGQVLSAIAEQGSVPTTPFQVTVTNSANWLADLGVYDLTASKQLTRVASSPATGQYSVSAGVYTFAAADTGHLISFNYSYSSTGGLTVSLTNQLMGAANTFTMLLFEQYAGQQSGVKLWAVAIPGIVWALKNTDFAMNSVNFSAYADSQNRVVDLYTAE